MSCIDNYIENWIVETDKIMWPVTCISLQRRANLNKHTQSVMQKQENPRFVRCVVYSKISLNAFPQDKSLLSNIQDTRCLLRPCILIFLLRKLSISSRKPCIQIDWTGKMRCVSWRNWTNHEAQLCSLCWDKWSLAPLFLGTPWCGCVILAPCLVQIQGRTFYEGF